MLLTVVLLTAATIAAAADPSSEYLDRPQVHSHHSSRVAVNGTSVKPTTLPTSNSTMAIKESSKNSKLNSTIESSTISSNITDSMESQRNTSGRAINFNMSEEGAENNSSEPAKGSLQDLSLDDIDMSSIMTTLPDMLNATSEGSTASGAETTVMPNMMPISDMCMEGNTMYKMGDVFNRSCDEMCKCLEGGKVICNPRCSGPTFRRGSRLSDPMCFEHPSDDPCCAILVCTHDTDPEPLEGCTYNNGTYQRGDTFNVGCESVCSCGEAGKVSCKPRCPAVAQDSSDRCVALPDPTDPCCTVVRCDVTLEDHDTTETGTEEHMMPSLQLLTAEVVNASAVRLSLVGNVPKNVTVEASMDQQVWKPHPSEGLVVVGLEPGHTYYLRATAGGAVSNAVEVVLPSAKPSSSPDMQMINGECMYKGQNYSVDQEFHDGCEAFCECSETGVECANIECPTEFGLDLVDSHCLEWDMQPDGFVPTPPKCCPDEVKCKNNGSCEFAGEIYNNWAEIPVNVTGCEKRCFCQFGNVTCQSVCPPVTATPPADIQCQPHEAILDHLPGDDCCLYWICPPLHHPGAEFGITALPGGFSHIPNIVSGQQPDEVVVQTLTPLDPHTVRLVFSVPPVLVGLYGHIELRYTADKLNNDISTWEIQVLAPPKELIATPQLEFSLGELQPDTEYRIKIIIILRDLHNSPSSNVVSVRTPSVQSTTLPPVVPVFPKLSATEVNTTWMTVSWNKFEDFELQLIDGIQLRYKQLDDKVYSTTPLIHRAVTSYIIENLKPNTKYEVGIFFIPFPGQSTELQADSSIQVTTAEVQDLYKFDVHVEVHHIKATSVEVNWTGVPYPVDKYVNIFRAIYQSDSGKEDFSTFKVAKRDSLSTTLIKDLIPGTRYRLWLEVYLTNGKIKKSNVQDFSTRPGSVSAVESSLQGKLESAPTPVNQAGDYYSPLVAVAILAALAILATLILLMILMRKHSQNKAAISTSRKSQSAYDNPSYKTCEDQASANGNGTAKTTIADPS